jgi:hypothetical protein
VSHVRYEDLLADTTGELDRLLLELTGTEPDPEVVAAAVQRYDFKHATGRTPGTEDRSSFLRKGVSGDWVNHFTREAGEIFDDIAGDHLVELGYAADRTWFRSL